MSVPLYVFFEISPKASYFEMSEADTHNNWWQRFRKVTEEKCPDGENIIMCDSSDGSRTFLIVRKYPDFEAYTKERNIWNWEAHFEHYFTVKTRFGYKREDWKQEHGEFRMNRDFSYKQ